MMSSYIVEGYQVTPKLVFEFKQEFGDENIVEIFLIKKDKELFLQNVRKSSTPNDWILENTSHEKTFGKIADMIILYGKYFEEEVKKYSCKLLSMDVNFDEKVDYICKHL